MYKKLTTFVISAHLATLLFLLFSPVKKTPKAHKHIAVRTLQPKPQPMTIVANKPQTAVKPTPKKTAAPKPAPIQKKSTVVEKNKPTPPARKPSGKTSIVKPQKVSAPPAWKEIDEALAKIDEKVYPSSKSTLDVPQIDIPPLECEESLVSFLHSSLNLPEFGEVTIQLTIKKDGSVARLVVMKAESIKNKTYLEQNLPTLKFPLILENEKTFTLTFCNEI